MDGVNETGGTIKATQEAIDSLLGVELPSVLFHNQRALLDLLESTDSSFKSSLASLVDLALWQKCEDVARLQEKRTKAECDAQRGELRVRT